MRKNQILQKFGDRITSLRVAQGFTQKGFAQHSGISRDHLAAIETGRTWISLKTLYKLCRGFKISPGKILNNLWEDENGSS